MSLFSGAGGLDIGAHQAAAAGLKIDTKVCIEYWKDACDTLNGYFRGYPQVANCSIVDILDPLGFWQQHADNTHKPDLIFGGPPCQSFSQAGKQKGIEDDRGNLVFDFLRFVEALQPSFFIMENVSNLKGVESGEILRKILSTAETLGYHVNTGVLSAADFGAPQLRKRIFFVGSQKKFGKVPFPCPTHGEGSSLFLRPFVTVGNAFDGLPPLIGTVDAGETGSHTPLPLPLQRAKLSSRHSGSY